MGLAQKAKVCGAKATEKNTKVTVTTIQRKNVVLQLLYSRRENKKFLIE